MDKKPICIIITGRPGSGKTTLADELSRRLYMPKLSRDEIKEGYVNTFGVKHDQLPKDTNGKVNEVFFETTLGLLKGNISLVIEAAFQHPLWSLIVPKIQQIARTTIVICDLDAQTSARRQLDYGFYHLDGKNQIPHLEMLLAIENLHGIQWIPGDGAPPPDAWLPLLKRIRDGGKLCQVFVSAEGALSIARELGGKGFAFMINDPPPPHEIGGLIQELYAL